MVNFESTDYIKINEDIKGEIVKLTRVIQELILLCKSNSLINQNRNKIKEKILMFNYTFFKAIKKQKIFLAYSDECDKNVLSKIIITLKHNKIDFTDWKKISDSGMITSHIVSAIIECKFGICYLSENKSDAEHTYADNSNVLLEAGMLCSLAAEPSNIASNWIPIREEKSAKIPFDLQSGRILIVPRTDDDQLQKQTFISSLLDRINKMMNT